jgi:O-antigen/teichoic acid export membrane protein
MVKQYFIKHKAIITDYVWRLMQIGSKQVITFIIMLLSANLLTVTEFGVLTYVLTSITFFTLLCDFGLSAAASKYVAEYNLTDKDKVKSILVSVASIIFIIALGIFILILIFGKYFLKENYIYVLLATPLLFFIPLTSLYDGIFRGLKKFRQLSLIVMISGLIFIGVMYILIIKLYLVGAILAQVLYYVLLSIILFVSYREYTWSIDKKTVKTVLSYSFIIGIASLGFYLFNSADLMILGYYGYFNVVSHYQIVLRLITLLATPILIFSQVIAPRVSDIYYKGNKKQFKELYLKSMKTTIVISLAVILVAIILHTFIFRIFFPKYDLAMLSLILFLMLIVLPFRFVGIIINNSFITTIEKAKYIAIPLLFCGVASVITDLLVVNISYVWVVLSSVVFNCLNIIITQYLFIRYMDKTD